MPIDPSAPLGPQVAERLGHALRRISDNHDLSDLGDNREPLTLALAQLTNRCAVAGILLDHPTLGKEDRADIARALFPSPVRDFIGESAPLMVVPVAQATLPLESDEQAHWVCQMLKDHTLDRVAGAGDADAIAALALVIAGSDGMGPSTQVAMLTRLFAPASGACETVAGSPDPIHIAATAFALIKCLPREHPEWQAALQTLLSDVPIETVAASRDAWCLGYTAFATCFLLDEDQRTATLRRLLTPDHQRHPLKADVVSQPNALAMAARAATQLPPEECALVLADLISEETIPVVAASQIPVAIAYTALASVRLPDGPRQAALAQLVTADNCRIVLDHHSDLLNSSMRTAAHHLPEGPQRQAALGALAGAPQWQQILASCPPGAAPDPSGAAGAATRRPDGPAPSP